MQQALLGRLKTEVESTATALGQLNCAAYQALQAASALRSEAARAGGERAAQAMMGDAPTGCPEVAVNIPEPGAPEEETPQVRLYRLLTEETNKVTLQFQQAERKAERAREKKDKTTSEIVTIRQELKGLESKPQDPAARSQVAAKRTALDVALEVLAAVTDLEKEAAAEMEQLAKDLQMLQDAYREVQEHPEKAPEYLKAIQEAKKE